MKKEEIKKVLIENSYDTASDIIEKEFKEKTNRIIAYSIMLFTAGFLFGFMFYVVK